MTTRPEHVQLRTFDEPMPITTTCRYCGDRLTAVGEWEWGMRINGQFDLAYVHTATDSPTCTIEYEAQPYDGWQASDAFRKAREERWAALDALEEAADA